LIDQIKRIVKGYLEAQQATDILFGTVSKDSPLEINVNQKFILPEAFLVVPEHMTRYEIDAKLIRRGLEVGDKVILIRAAGGGQYVVMGRITE